MGNGNKRAGRKSCKENVESAEVADESINDDAEDEKQIAERVRIAQGLYDIGDTVGVVNSKQYPKNNGKMGIIQKIEDGLIYGEWGKGYVDPTTDTFRVFKKEYIESQLRDADSPPIRKRGRKKKT